MSRLVNILATTRLDEDEIHAIQAVDRGIRIRCSTNREETDRLLPDSEILLSSWNLDANVAAAKRLKWIHVMAAGLDYLMKCRQCRRQLSWDGQSVIAAAPCKNEAVHEPYVQALRDVTLTTASGIAALPIAEYAIAMMLAYARRLPELYVAQAERRWLPLQSFVSKELYGATLGIIGLGHIGEEVAVRARPFGMRIIATRRSVKTVICGEGASPADEIFPTERIKEVLAQSDYVLLSVPLTTETEGMIGEEQLKAMKLGSFLINIARGKVVDEEALTRALQEGWIAGAALDVTAREPLSASSPLWDMPNVFVTPHIAGVTEAYSQRCINQFCENLGRYIAGEQLFNVFDFRRGY